MQIPSCFVATCEFCGEQLDIRKGDDVSLCVSGWVREDRVDDFELSDIKQPEPTNRWAHRSCVERAEMLDEIRKRTPKP